MFDLYHAPDQAAYRQAELYERIATDQLLKGAVDAGSTDDRVSPARKVIVFVTDVMASVSAAFATAGRRPHRI
ncbi:MAG: hypothetical protein ACJ779_08105 [Chloroflexota bacterium]